MSSINATYVAAAPDIFDRVVRYNSESGYMFGYGIILLVAVVAASRVVYSGGSSTSAAAYAGFWALLASALLWGSGWVPSQAVTVSLSYLILIILIIVLGKSN